MSGIPLHTSDGFEEALRRGELARLKSLPYLPDRVTHKDSWPRYRRACMNNRGWRCIPWLASKLPEGHGFGVDDLALAQKHGNAQLVRTVWEHWTPPAEQRHFDWLRALHLALAQPDPQFATTVEQTWFRATNSSDVAKSNRHQPAPRHWINEVVDLSTWPGVVAGLWREDVLRLLDPVPADSAGVWVERWQAMACQAGIDPAKLAEGSHGTVLTALRQNHVGQAMAWLHTDASWPVRSKNMFYLVCTLRTAEMKHPPSVHEALHVLDKALHAWASSPNPQWTQDWEDLIKREESVYLSRLSSSAKDELVRAVNEWVKTQLRCAWDAHQLAKVLPPAESRSQPRARRL